MRRLAIVTILMCLSLSQVQAEGRMMYGAGMITCAEWQKYRQSGNKTGALQAQAYVDGYLSGYNTASNDPDFLLPAPKSIAYYAWIDNYCAMNPLDALIQAVLALRDELSKRAAPNAPRPR